MSQNFAENVIDKERQWFFAKYYFTNFSQTWPLFLSKLFGFGYFGSVPECEVIQGYFKSVQTKGFNGIRMSSLR